MAKALTLLVLTFVCCALLLPSVSGAAEKKGKKKTVKELKEIKYVEKDPELARDLRMRKDLVFIAEDVLNILPILSKLANDLNSENKNVVKDDLYALFYKIDKLAADIDIPLFRPETLFEPLFKLCLPQAKRIVTALSQISAEETAITLIIEAILEISYALPQAILDCGGEDTERKYGKYYKTYARGGHVDPQSLE